MSQMEPNPLTRRHTKAERHAFGAMITIPPPRAILAARTPAGTPGTVAPELLHGAATATRTARNARKTLGWMMAASAAAQEAEATSLAATKARLTTRQGGKTAKASHLVVAAAHVDTTTHYQTTDDTIHPLHTVPADLGPRTRPSARQPLRRPGAKQPAPRPPRQPQRRPQHRPKTLQPLPPMDTQQKRRSRPTRPAPPPPPRQPQRRPRRPVPPRPRATATQGWGQHAARAWGTC